MAEPDAPPPASPRLASAPPLGGVGRFAPSTTGPAHPGTLLAALLCWLDARSRGGEIVLRLENLDPQRCKPAYLEAIVRDLAWLGLEFDRTQTQSENAQAHAEAMDALAAAGHLYPCRCTRSGIQRVADRAPDGSARYPGTCRDRALPSPAQGGWRSCDEAIRLRLAPQGVDVLDESGLDLSAPDGASIGDPVVQRRDGAMAYHLASVVDDHASGVSRVVRGRDLAGSTPVQVAVQQMLGYATPTYRHHLLLLEERGDKLAKLHGAVGAAALREHHSAAELCGVLAFAVGLLDAPSPITPAELLPGFAWSKVAADDRVVRWTGSALVVADD